MITKTLLAVAITAGLISPVPAARPDTPAAAIAAGQPATIHDRAPGTEQSTHSSAPTEGSPATLPAPSAVPPRPHYVAGYTPHALQNMAARHITKAQVEALIASPTPGIYQDDNDTWLVTDGILIVIINKNAWIVTGFGKD